MSNGFYELEVAGLKRHLPKVRVGENLVIASFVMLGDTDLVERSADELVMRLPRERIEMLVCLEAKGIPLTHAIARRLGVNYVTVRKSVKGYMEDPLIEEVKSITTKEKQILVLDGVDRAKITGKKVCVVDDVVSTGGSMKAVQRLLERAGATVVCKAAVLLEEGGYDGADLIYLERLPVFAG
ncbi:MAG: phosphoribosyltransferase family protein [Thermovirgaceae bacterium]